MNIAAPSRVGGQVNLRGEVVGDRSGAYLHFGLYFLGVPRKSRFSGSVQR